MATHSGTLAWEIPWTKEPGRLPSMGLQRVGHDWGLTIVNHTPRAQKGVLLLPHRQGYAPLSHPFHSSMNNNRGCNRICPPPSSSFSFGVHRLWLMASINLSQQVLCWPSGSLYAAPVPRARLWGWAQQSNELPGYVGGMLGHMRTLGAGTGSQVSGWGGGPRGDCTMRASMSSSSCRPFSTRVPI